MSDNSIIYFTIRCINLQDTIEDGYEKDTLDRFLNQYISRGVHGPVRYFCRTENEVYENIRVVMEFMQQNLASVNEIFEMIQSIELEKWSVKIDGEIKESQLLIRSNLTRQDFHSGITSEIQLIKI